MVVTVISDGIRYHLKVVLVHLLVFVVVRVGFADVKLGWRILLLVHTALARTSRL